MPETPPRTLAEIERDLGPLAPEEQEWVLGRLAVTAPSAIAEALSALGQRRAGTLPQFEEIRTPDGELTLAHRPTTAPTVRGGPELDLATEAEYREERRT